MSTSHTIRAQHMHKKFEINWTKIKGDCQSGRKVVTHISKNDLPPVEYLLRRTKKDSAPMCSALPRLTSIPSSWISFTLVPISCHTKPHKRSLSI